MIAEETTLPRFVLEAIDPATECVVTEAKLQTPDASAVLDLLAPDARALVLSGASCDLEPDEVEKVKACFAPAFEPGVLPVRLRPACRHDELPYLVHTGRELALMLEGRKPLAVFSGTFPSVPDREDIPERLFDPHVVAGKFIKRERVFGGGSAGKPTRTVLYALPQEAWRIDAYLLLHDTAAKVGWSEGFERMEGSLLGYEEWQTDIFIEQVYRAAGRSRRTS